MRLKICVIFRFFSVFILSFAAQLASAQSGNAGSISGTVTDPSGALLPNASVEITNPVSQYSRTANTDKTGRFNFSNIPFNSYHFTVTAPGFSANVRDVDVRSSVPLSIAVALKVTANSQTVTVESTAGDLVESDPTFHVDVDRDLFIKVPLESVSSTLSALVTQTTPGVAADSNGLFHGLGFQLIFG